MVGRRKNRFLVRGLAGCLLVVCLACGADNQTGSSVTEEEILQAQEQRLGDWQSDYDEMVTALGLDAESQASLESAFLERDRRLRNWFDGPKGRRLIELEALLAKEAQNRDLQSVRSITAEGKPLRAEVRDLIKASDEEVLAVLTPEQRGAWDGYLLSKRLLELMESLELSPEQIEALRDNAPRFLDQAKQAGEPNPPAAAFLQYERWAERQVLDPVQQGMYAGTKRENPLRSLR